MITDADIRAQVLQALSGHVGDFNVEAVVRTIIDLYGRVDIDTIPDEQFWLIVREAAN